jgi:hypothetical protein
MAFKRSSVRSRSAPPIQNTNAEAEIGERSGSYRFNSPGFSPICLSSRFHFSPLFFPIQVAPKVAPEMRAGFSLVALVLAPDKSGHPSPLPPRNFFQAIPLRRRGEWKNRVNEAS